MLAYVAALIIAVFGWRLIQVPPNKVAVITRKSGTTFWKEGYTWIKRPFERLQGFISLEQWLITLTIREAYTKFFVPVDVDAVALVKIKGEDAAISIAAERYLNIDEEQIQNQVQQCLIGHLRAMLATLSVEEINSDRQALANRTAQESLGDLDKMGITIDALVIQHVIDEAKDIIEGEQLRYFDALGQKNLSEARREAVIQASQNRRDAETFKATQEADISEAERDRDLRRAQYSAEVAQAQATAEQAGPQASAVARQGVVTEEVRIEERRTEANINVQEQEIERRRKELEATVVRPAEADREAAIARAEGERMSRIKVAEAVRIEREQEGTGEGKKIREIGEGEATVIQMKAEASAAGERARLLAQAEGQEKLVGALNAYEENGIRISIARELVERFPQIVEAASKPLGEIDKVVMIDAGSGSRDGPISSFMANAPIQITRSLEMLKEATGIDLVDLLQKGNSDRPDQDGKQPAHPGPEDGESVVSGDSSPTLGRPTDGLLPEAAPSDEPSKEG